MPVAFDSTSNDIYACDMQRMFVYKFSESGNWQTHMTLRTWVRQIHEKNYVNNWLESEVFKFNYLKTGHHYVLVGDPV
jgi:hypothetical protein